MAINYNTSITYGSVTATSECGTKVKCNLVESNCLLCVLYDDGKYNHLVTFANDKQHLINICKDWKPVFGHLSKWTFNKNINKTIPQLFLKYNIPFNFEGSDK